MQEAITMTGYDIQNAMNRAFGISSSRDIDTVETVDLSDLGNRLARLFALLGLTIKGSL
jgi:hypothetical protein